jgi:hypothetical protein
VALLAAPEGFWRPFVKCPKSIGDLLTNAFKVVEILWDMSNKSEASAGTLHAVFPDVFLAMYINRRNPQESFQTVVNKETCLADCPVCLRMYETYSVHFLEALQLLLNLSKVEDLIGKLRNHQRSFF